MTSFDHFFSTKNNIDQDKKLEATTISWVDYGYQLESSNQVQLAAVPAGVAFAFGRLLYLIIV